MCAQQLTAKKNEKNSFSVDKRLYTLLHINITTENA